jgi:hypothetical protein
LYNSLMLHFIEGSLIKVRPQSSPSCLIIKFQLYCKHYCSYIAFKLHISNNLSCYLHDVLHWGKSAIL